MGPRLVPVLVFSLSFCLGKVYGQPEGVITLVNPSFEDMPRHSKPPRGWFDCGVPGETPPDVQPSGTFSVTKPAVNGDTYLGMVVRDNDTWEMVSQRMSAPMKKGQCYAFSIYLCRSELYVSVSRKSDETANYTTPAKLRIYGGFDHCDKQYLLGETNLVINTRWLEYQFKFEPLDNYTHISFEAFYKTPTLFPYNGNILLDNASDITPISCNEELSERLPQKSTETPKSTPAPLLPLPNARTASPNQTSPSSIKKRNRIQLPLNQAKPPLRSSKVQTSRNFQETMSERAKPCGWTISCSKQINPSLQKNPMDRLITWLVSSWLTQIS